MPRKDRSYSTDDLIRIIENNLSAVEQAEVVFELRFGPMRRLMELGTGFDEEDMRQLNKLIIRLQGIRGSR